MKRELTLIPKISIHPSQINIYNEAFWDPGPPVREKSPLESKYYIDIHGNIIEEKKSKISHIIDSDRKAHGKVSKTASKKMKKSIEYLLLLSNPKSVQAQYTGRTFSFKIAFITLTLPSPQQHPDTEIINKCLNQFIIEIKKNHQVKHYIWRAEKQKNGNIHFHILINKFIHWNDIRNRWNRIINKLGYVDRYREIQETWHKNGFKVREDMILTWPAKKQWEAYKRNAGIQWNNPNSTDIHSIRKIRNIKLYLTKYLLKQPDGQKEETQECNNYQNQTGRIWGCNRELSNIKGAATEIDSSIENDLEKLNNDKSVYCYEDTFFSVYYIDLKSLKDKGCNVLFSMFAAYMMNQFGHPLQLDAFP
jgi:hypothetical protein